MAGKQRLKLPRLRYQWHLTIISDGEVIGCSKCMTRSSTYPLNAAFFAMGQQDIMIPAAIHYILWPTRSMRLVVINGERQQQLERPGLSSAGISRSAGGSLTKSWKETIQTSQISVSIEQNVIST